MDQRGSTFAAVAVRHVAAYVDLIQSDLDAGARVARRRLVAFSVMAAAILLMASVICGWIIAAAWNTPQRSWVLGGLVAGLLLIALGAFYRIHALRSAPTLLSQTANEFSHDRNLLMALLQGEQGTQP